MKMVFKIISSLAFLVASTLGASAQTVPAGPLVSAPAAAEPTLAPAAAPQAAATDSPPAAIQPGMQERN